MSEQTEIVETKKRSKAGEAGAKVFNRINAETIAISKERQDEFLKLYLSNPYATMVCKQMEMSYNTFLNWITKDPTFKPRYEQVQKVTNDYTTDTALGVVKRGMLNKGGEWLAVEWLRKYHPDFAERLDIHGTMAHIQLVSHVRDKVDAAQDTQGEVVS